MQLKNQTILLISPQAWGKMFLAKHHYAIELARAGNEVYFLNPPQRGKAAGNVEVKPSGIVPNLFIVNHSLPFSYKIRFKWMGLFHFLMRFHVNRIRKKIGKKITIVWSFDLGHYYPFRFFERDAYKIYHPIDEPQGAESIAAARGANIILSVTKEILEKFNHFPVPKVFIHHGLSQEFADVMPLPKAGTQPVHVGMSGNWLRPDIDTNVLKKIILENPEVIFHVWGSYEAGQSNIGGGENSNTQSLTGFLKEQPHVKLYGPVGTKELATAFAGMDAFLICYDIEKDQSKGTNYHKVMEYLGTGKVVISNNITTYAAIPGLIEMSASRTGNEELPGLFKTVLGKLDHYNSTALMQQRRNFALANLYAGKVAEVEKHLPL